MQKFEEEKNKCCVKKCQTQSMQRVKFGFNEAFVPINDNSKIGSSNVSSLCGSVFAIYFEYLMTI